MFLCTNFELSVLIIFFFEKKKKKRPSSGELNSNVRWLPGHFIKETRITFIKTLLKNFSLAR